MVSTALATPDGDPVLRAIAATDDDAFGSDPHVGFIALEGGPDAIWSRITFVRAKEGNEPCAGYVCVAFRSPIGTVHYHNDGGARDVRFAKLHMPETLVMGAVGRRLSELVDIPGLAKARIASVEPEEAFDRWLLRIEPVSAEG